MKEDLKTCTKLTANLLLDILTSLFHCARNYPREKENIEMMKDVLSDYIELYNDDPNKRPKDIIDLANTIHYDFPYIHYSDRRELNTNNYKEAYKYAIPLVINIQKKYIDIYSRYITTVLKEIDERKTDYSESMSIRKELEDLDARCSKFFNTKDMEYIKNILHIDKYLKSIKH